MENLLKKKMDAGQRCIGTFVWMGGANAVEALSCTGADFAIIDTEHGPFDIESSMEMIRAMEGSGVTACARIKDSTRPSVLKMLDIGARALIIPNIRSVEEVKKLVEYGKYYPMGERGVAFARGCKYGFADWVSKDGMQGYFDICNRETLLLPQCETRECLEHIDEIVSIEGISGIFIGPYDLSSALGIPGQFGAPEYKAAIDKIYKSVLAAKKYLFIFAGTEEAAIANFEKGANAVCLSSDLKLFANAAKASFAKCR